MYTYTGWPRVGCRIGYECKNDKLIQWLIAITLILIALFCNPLLATFMHLPVYFAVRIYPRSNDKEIDCSILILIVFSGSKVRTKSCCHRTAHSFFSYSQNDLGGFVSLRLRTG